MKIFHQIQQNNKIWKINRFDRIGCVLEFFFRFILFSTKTSKFCCSFFSLLCCFSAFFSLHTFNSGVHDTFTSNSGVTSQWTQYFFLLSLINSKLKKHSYADTSKKKKNERTNGIAKKAYWWNETENSIFLHILLLKQYFTKVSKYVEQASIMLSDILSN